MNGRWRECSWGRPGSWTSRWSLSRWWAPTMSTISWCPLFRYRVTRKSPCQLCLCQTDDWTGQTQVIDQNLTYFHFDLTLGLIWPLICLISSSNYLNRDSWMKLINFFDLLLCLICPPKCLITCLDFQYTANSTTYLYKIKRKWETDVISTNVESEYPHGKKNHGIRKGGRS